MTSKREVARIASLLPNGMPKKIRVYNNANGPTPTFDNITVVFTGSYQNRMWVDGKTEESYEIPARTVTRHDGSTYESAAYTSSRRRTPRHVYLFCNDWVICAHEESSDMVDRPTYGHLGKKVAFATLTPELQKAVTEAYCELWDIIVPQGEAVTRESNV